MMSFLLLETFPAFPIRSGTFAVFTVPLLGGFVQAVPAPICSKSVAHQRQFAQNSVAHRRQLVKKPGFSGAGTPAQLSLPQGPLHLPGAPSAPENKKARTFRPALSAVKICEFSSFSLYPHSSLPKKARFYGGLEKRGSGDSCTRKGRSGGNRCFFSCCMLYCHQTDNEVSRAAGTAGRRALHCGTGDTVGLTRGTEEHESHRANPAQRAKAPASFPDRLILGLHV